MEGLTGEGFIDDGALIVVKDSVSVEESVILVGVFVVVGLTVVDGLVVDFSNESLMSDE